MYQICTGVHVRNCQSDFSGTSPSKTDASFTFGVTMLCTEAVKTIIWRENALNTVKLELSLKHIPCLPMHSLNEVENDKTEKWLQFTFILRFSLVWAQCQITAHFLWNILLRHHEERLIRELSKLLLNLVIKKKILGKCSIFQLYTWLKR